MRRKYRPLTVEDWIIIVCGVVALCIVLYFLTGCAAKQAQAMRMIWHDGECMLYIDGMQAEQAEELQKDWSMEQCDVAVQSRAGKEEPPPEGEG